MTRNFETGNPESRSLPRPVTGSPPSLSLRQSPLWPVFEHKLGRMILNKYPDLRMVYLELLDEIDPV